MERTAFLRLMDVGLVVVLAALGVAEIWLPLPSVMGEGSREVTTAVVLLVTGMLVARRRWPLQTAIGVLWLWPAVFLLEPVLVLFWGQFVPMVVAVFSVARHGRGKEPWLGAGIGAATLLFLDLHVQALQSVGEIVFHWMVFTVAWCFGWALQKFEQRADASVRRARQAEAASAEQALAAVLEERSRIARELHDIVAHSVSVMVVQAGAAEQAVDDDPEFVRQALLTVRSTGANALAEMRRVLAVLRDDEQDGPLGPQPGLDAMPALLEEVRRAGVDATAAVEGLVRALPPGLDLAAYRIIQEALTNVRRHANARRAAVVVRYTASDVVLEVTDDGTGSSNGVDGSGGHGLLGMRERISLYGGELETVTGTGEGFTVRARLPLEPA